MSAVGSKQVGSKGERGISKIERVRPLVGWALALVLLALGIYGTTSEWITSSLPLLAFAPLGLLVSLVLLVKPDKRSLGLVSLVGLSGVFLIWRASESTVYLYGMADLSLAAMATCAWLIGRWLSGSRWGGLAFLLGLSGLMVFNAYGAWLQYQAPGWTWLAVIHPNEEHLSGLFFHRNYFACLMGAGGLLLAAFAVWGTGDRYWRWLFGLFSLLGFGAVAVAQSRGALIAMGGGVLAFGLTSAITAMRVKRRWRGTIVIGTLVLTMASLIAGGVLLQKTLGQRGYDGDVNLALSSNGRTESLWLAIKVGQDAPLIGHGARAFEYESIPRWESSSLWQGTGNLNFVHNEWGQAFADYGLIGFGLLVAIAFSHLIAMVWQILKLNGRDVVGKGPSSMWPGWLVGAASLCVFMIIQSNFSFIFHFPVILFLVATTLGFASSASFGRPGLLRWRLPGGESMLVRLALMPYLLAATALLAANLKGITAFADVQAIRDPRTTPELRQQHLEAHLDKLPDWRIAKQLAEARAAQLPRDPNNLHARQLDDAIAAYRDVLDLYPHDPGSRLALANLLSLAKQYQAAEDEFQQVIETAIHREFWLKQRWIYGIHLYRWATDLYYQRRHRDALEKIKLAREQYDGRRMNHVESWRQQRQNIDRFIDFLESEVIPSLDDN